MAAFTTAPIKVSFPTLVEPRGYQGSTPKYSVVLMFDKSNTEQMASLDELESILQQTFDDKFDGAENAPRIPVKGHNKSYLKDADTAVNQNEVPLVEKNPEYKGHYIARANSTYDVDVVDADCNDIEPSTIKGGNICRVALNVYAYKSGVTAGLQAVQFMEKGEPFGGTNARPPVSELFGKGVSRIGGKKRIGGKHTPEAVTTKPRARRRI